MDKPLLKKAAMTARRSFTEEISGKCDDVRIVEETAYAWFIRCIALRYMQINRFLPCSLDWTAREVCDCCIRMHQAYPDLFTEVSERQKQLMPSLKEEVLSLFGRIRKEDWFHQPQIIGWLIQYYNTESKEKVFRQLKNRVKIQACDIPSVTQLFTPEWIVDFMVQNTLFTGKKQEKKYRILDEKPLRDPENFRCIDPCMGSGHILLKVFDELMEAYLSKQVAVPQAVRLILKENLAGLDIDPAAYHVTHFCLLMRAREWDETILDEKVEMKLAVFLPLDEEKIREKTPEKLKEAMHSLCRIMEKNTERGSLIRCHEKFSEEFVGYFKDRDKAVEHDLRCVSLLSGQYDAVITNPPYMGHAGMTRSLSDYVRDHYPEGKLDLYACFILRCMELTKEKGLCAMITQHSWMFLSSYKKLREKILAYDLKALLHLGSRSFEEINGEVVQTVCFILKKTVSEDNKALCYRLLDGEGELAKRDDFLSGKGVYTVDQKQLLSLPGKPLAYWVTDPLIHAFHQAPALSEVAQSRQGMATADNEQFVRRWYEVDRRSICFDAENREQAQASHARWFPYNKGGNMRKWYGNNEYVVDWEDNGRRIREYPGSVIRNEHHFFEECFSWSLIGTGSCTFRYKPKGQCFDVAGMSCFSKDHLEELLAFCNTPTAQSFLQVIAPTINVQCGDVARLPVLFDTEHREQIQALVHENIQLAKQDWDQFETSWDFTVHPMLQGKDILEGLECWRKECQERFDKVWENEQKLSDLYAELYGMEKKKINNKDITIVRFSDSISRGKLDSQKAVRTLLHYAIGCMLKRYTVPGYTSCVTDNWLVLTEREDGTFTDCLKEWLSCVYPKADPEVQLQQIAEILDPDKETEQALKSYFCHDFYEEHLRMYQKRPIYWMIDAGKRNGFKALCSIHHWQTEAIPVLLKNHLLPHQQALVQQRDSLKKQRKEETEPQLLQQLKNQILKEQLQLDQVNELVSELQDKACQKIELDLDRGVKANLQQFRIFTRTLKKGQL